MQRRSWICSLVSTAAADWVANEYAHSSFSSSQSSDHWLNWSAWAFQASMICCEFIASYFLFHGPLLFFARCTVLAHRDFNDWHGFLSVGNAELLNRIRRRDAARFIGGVRWLLSYIAAAITCAATDRIFQPPTAATRAAELHRRWHEFPVANAIARLVLVVANAFAFACVTVAHKRHLTIRSTRRRFGFAVKSRAHGGAG